MAKKNHNLGERDLPKADVELPGTHPTERPKAYFADDLIEIFTVFRDRVYNPQSALYPSSGFDGSPARVFDKVTFVDLEEGNEGCIEALQEEGLHAIKGDIRTYSPESPHDLLILFNPGIPTEWTSTHLRSGGYVLTNNYHGNASEMYRQPDEFTLWGVIDFAKQDGRGNNRVVVSRNLDDLFQPVANEEELKHFRPGYYELLLGLFRSFATNMPNFSADGPFEEVWKNYREITQEGMPSKRVADRYIFVKK